MSNEMIDLNKASADELSDLPGIGKSLARRIIAYRENNHFEDIAGLADVTGISEQMAGDLAKYLTVEFVEEVNTSTVATDQEARLEMEQQTEPGTASAEINGRSVNQQKLVRDLRTAARNGDTKKLKSLISQGADGRDKFALIWASQAGRYQTVSELIKAGADVNRLAGGGTNALELAAQNGHLEIVKILIESGADIDQPGIQGWTPLMKAAYFGHQKIVQALVDSGAEKTRRDMKGRTALNHAQRAGHRQIVNLLSS